jgi:hypothetical protein
VGVLQRTSLLVYAVPVVWGLVAVWAAENGDHPLRAGAAALAAAIVAVAAVAFEVLDRRRRT